MANWKACFGDGIRNSGRKRRDPQVTAALLKKDFLQLQADFRTVNDTLERLEAPEVLVKSIRENQRLAECA